MILKKLTPEPGPTPEGVVVRSQQASRSHHTNAEAFPSVDRGGGNRLVMETGGEVWRIARRCNLLYHFDAHLAARSRERRVSCDQWGIKRLGKGEVSGIIGRQTMPHLPDAGE